MKCKKLLSVALAVCMTFGSAAALPQNAFSNQTEITASAATTAKWKAKDVLGTWKGNYTGYNSNSEFIIRQISLKVYECSSNGEIKGYAFIDDGTNGFYEFKGSFDFKHGSVEFKGEKWLENPNNFGFADFVGIIDINDKNHSLSINGRVDNEKVRTFSLNKTSDDYKASISDLNSIPKDWVGEYDGQSGEIVVRRNYQIHIDSIAEDGSITGIANFSPSSKADISLGRTGSYKFKGTVNASTGMIKLKGDSWINKPEDNFTFVSLSGYLDQNRIIGSSENGIWEMSCLGRGKGTAITKNKTIKFSYGNYNEPIRQYSFVYNDNWLLKDSDTLNKNIAKFSANLAVAAYEKKTVTKCLEQMGFAKSSIQTFSSYDFMPTYEDNDRVAFTIAHKKVNGKNIFVVPIRGTHGNCEWLSNFNLGTGENHEGFYRAANKVKYALASSFSNVGAKPSNTIVYFTGHSRGAAVANILAGELCTKGIKSVDGKTDYVIPLKQVFGYTYACPAVSRALNKTDTKLKNIYNYINPGDLIPSLPLSDWGYKRYGKEIKYPIEEGNVAYSFLHKFYDFYKDKDGKNVGYGALAPVAELETAFKGLAKNQKEFNTNPNKALFEYVAIMMMNDDASYIPWTKAELKNKVKEKYGVTLAVLLGYIKVKLDYAPMKVKSAIASLFSSKSFSLLESASKVASIGDSISHGHTGETYVKWTEALYDSAKNYTHKYSKTIVKPTFCLDGYTESFCKICGKRIRTNYTKFNYNSLSNDILRIQGSNRYETSIEISKQCNNTSDTVILALGTEYADALSGVPLAQLYNAPILLTSKDTLPEDVLAEIKRLKASSVIILGGTGAISENVEKTLNNKKIITVRIAGKNRFDTATRVANEISEIHNYDTVFFAYYNNFADALSVSHVAAIKGAPIIYLKKDGDLDDGTAKYLASVKGKIKKAYVIGGAGVISEDMMKKTGNILGLKTGKTIKRIAGNNRYTTCINVNNEFKSILIGKDICIAKGLAFPDALAGGVLAARTKSPLILADYTLNKNQQEYLKNKKAAHFCVFGGTGAVPQDLVNSIVRLSR